MSVFFSFIGALFIKNRLFLTLYIKKNAWKSGHLESFTSEKINDILCIQASV